MQKVWVLCGGESTEYEVSINSAKVICEEIRLDGRIVRPVVITKHGRWLIEDRDMKQQSDRAWASGFLSDAISFKGKKLGSDIGAALGQLLHENVDCVFMGLHGQYGEDGRLQGFLETAGIPYTGSGVLSSALAFDKAASIERYRAAGLQTARSICVCRQRRNLALGDLRLPVFVKPVRGGSSVGMTLVQTADELDEAIEKALGTDDEALVEEKIEGVEVSCAVLELKQEDEFIPTPLVPTEIRPLQSDFFDYEAKYVNGMSREITPAELDEATNARIQESALAAHMALKCEGVSRTDMIIPPGKNSLPVLLETNTLPGLTRTSLLPQQAKACGIETPELFDLLIENAIRKAKGSAALKKGKAQKPKE